MATSMHSGYYWDPKYRSKWEVASEPWQLFLQYWRKATDPLVQRDLHALTIVPPNITTLLIFESLIPILDRNEHGKILVLKSYPTLVDRILNRYQHEPRSGVVITGQPGIGKSVLLCYLLTILLNRLPHTCAPIFLYCHDIRILFYGDVAYEMDDDVFKFKYLPQQAKPEYGPVWALIDIDDNLEEPKGLQDSTVFAVQAASLNPMRYKQWSRIRKCARWGLPLWTADELSEGLKLQIDYGKLITGIEAWLNTDASGGDTRDMSNDANNMLADEHRLVLNANRAEFQRAEDAVECLLKYAQKRYGQAAQDVYDYLCNPADVVQRHDSVFACGGHHAWTFAMTFTTNFLVHGIADSSRFIAIDVNPPRRASDPLDTFSLLWKSTHVEQKMKRLAEELDNLHLAQWYSLTHRSPASATFASHIYEVYVHHTICSGAALLSLQPMRKITASDEPDRITYSTTADAFSKYPPFPNRKRCRSRYSSSNLITLSFEHYYVPNQSSDSPFLFVEENDKVVLLVLQISLALVHLGSPEDLEDIQTLKEQARVTFGQEVEVRYVLICPVFIPTERHPRKWKLPTKGLTHSIQCSMYYLGLPLPYIDPQIKNQVFKEKELKGKEREEQEEQEEQEKVKQAQREQEQEAQPAQTSTKKRKPNVEMDSKPENLRKKNKI